MCTFKKNFETMNWIKKFTSAHYDGGRKRCKKYCTLLSVNSFKSLTKKNCIFIIEGTLSLSSVLRYSFKFFEEKLKYHRYTFFSVSGSRIVWEEGTWENWDGLTISYYPKNGQMIFVILCQNTSSTLANLQKIITYKFCTI